MQADRQIYKLGYLRSAVFFIGIIKPGTRALSKVLRMKAVNEYKSGKRFKKCHIILVSIISLGGKSSTSNREFKLQIMCPSLAGAANITQKLTI